MEQIGLVINPYSKRIKKMSDPVGYYKKVCGGNVDIRLTKSMEDVENAALDFKKNGISYLAISGGDGSIHNVISKLYKSYGNNELPHILILKDGSMNNIAKSYRLSGQGTALLKKLVNAVNRNENIKIEYRDTIAANGMCCFLFGLGYTATLINEFNKGGKKGPVKAIRVILKTICSALMKSGSDILKSMDLTLVVDGKRLPIKNYFAVYASTIRNLALGFYPTPRAYEKDNTFQIIATGLRPLQVLIRINKIRTGKTIIHPMHFDDIASELEILYPGEFLYQMDGDVYTARDGLKIIAGPRVGFVSI